MADEIEKRSLLDAEKLQLALFEEEEQGHFTGERLFERRRLVYNEVVRYLIEGVSMRRIARLLQVSINTIRAVRDRELKSNTAENERQALAHSMLDLATDTTEAMHERLEDPEARKKIPFKDLAIATGIVTEKHQLLSGGPTARVEHQAEIPHDEWMRQFEAATKTVEAEFTMDDGQKELGEGQQDKEKKPDGSDGLDGSGKDGDHEQE